MGTDVRSELRAERHGGTIERTTRLAQCAAREEVADERRWMRLCAIADAFVLAAAVGIAGGREAAEAQSAHVLLWLYPFLVTALIAQRHGYRPRIARRCLDVFGDVLRATSVGAMIVLALASVLEHDVQPSIVVAWLIGSAALPVVRYGLMTARRQALAAGGAGSPTIILGAGRVAAQVERRLLDRPELGLRPIGVLDDDHPENTRCRAPVLGRLNDLPELARTREIGDVIVAFPACRGRDGLLRGMLDECCALGIRVSVVPRFFESGTTAATVADLGALPVFTLHPADPNGWQFAIKHALDRIVAALLLAVLSPLLAVIALAVRMSSPGPVLLRQTRIGCGGRPFEILKFRSMRPGAVPTAPPAVEAVEPDVAPGGVEGEDRRTKVGRFIRRTSLDELAQLINVVRGEMSLVGPRPERPEYVDLYERRFPRYAERHRVRPGITGWAQVHGLRGKTSISDRLAWDNFYIANWSLTLDVKILLLTLSAVVRGAE